MELNWIVVVLECLKIRWIVIVLKVKRIVKVDCKDGDRDIRSWEKV